MKILFAPDTSDHPNWGCRVMGDWYKRNLAKNGFPPSWLAPSAWFMNPHPALPDLNTLEDFRRYAAAVEAGSILADITLMLRQCDAVVLNGENFIRPGSAKGRMLLFLAYLAKQVFRKPCLLLNHTVELQEPALAEIARELYPLLDEVQFREETSAAACSSFLPPGRWRVVPDVAFAVPAAPLSEWCDLGRRDGHFSAWPDLAEGFDPGRPYVTVCASSIFAQPEHRTIDPVPAFIQLCRRLTEAVGPVLLAAPCEVDTRILRRVQAATGLPLLGNNLPVRQAIDVLGNAAVHVGGRWHLAIFAATGGTPTVAFSANSHKVHSLMRQLGMEEPVLDVLDLEANLEAVVGRVRSYQEAGPDLRRRLLARSRELGAQVEHNLDWLKAKAGRA